MSMNRPLPLPSWYNPKLIANPLFQPNQAMIQKEAYRIAREFGVQRASKDTFRVCRLHVDEQGDFTQPLTAVDPETGKVTRYIPAVFQGLVEVPEWWNEGDNDLIWHDGDFDPTTLLSITGGRLSVPGAWNDTRRSVEWDLRNAHMITTHAYTMDSHGWTSRFDMHFWQARPNNPYGLPAGSHPYPFMEGPDKAFPVITPESCYHPRHNPDGWWRGIAKGQKYVDETWDYVNALKVVVLWTMHCNRYTQGQTLDPMVLAVNINHTFMRGWLEAEPLWFPKGLSWRTEFFGVHGPEYEIEDDENAQPTLNVLQLFDGFPELGIPPFDLVVESGQAGSHCVLRSQQQQVQHAQESGRDDCIRKIVYLTDTSSIIPGFEEETRKAQAELEDAGLRMETTKTFNLYSL